MESLGQEFTLHCDGAAGPEEVALLQHSHGAHAFFMWHGFDAVNRFWRWEYLWPYGQITLVGLPGHGPVRPRGPGHYARWTPGHFFRVGADAVQRLGGDRAVTLVGHCTGAAVALGVARLIPERVAGLILVNPVVWSPLEGAARRVFHSPLWQDLGRCALIGKYLFRRSSASAYLRFVRTMVYDPEEFLRNPRVVRYVRDGHPHYRRTSLDALVGTARVIARLDLRPALTQAPPTVPTLILHGERDPVVPFAQGRWLAQHLPRAELVPLAQVGHIGFGEREERFRATVLRWLDARTAQG